MTPMKIAAGQPFPDLRWNAVGGGEVYPQGGTGWRALVVYRGKHCPLCKSYLTTLDGLLDRFSSTGITVAAVSADPIEKAQAQVDECGWKFPVGYGLTEQDMRALGLYISAPRSAAETDRNFSEPGLFVLNPQGNVQIVDVSNAPFARPDLSSLLNGLEFVIRKDYPVRGRV